MSSMKRQQLRPILGLTILIATLTAFIYYFAHHTEVRHQLSQTSPATLGLIAVLYCGFVFSMSLVTAATVQLCNARLSLRESVLLTMYSSIVNFFGPLQSGPAFRALYLKKRHGIQLKNYTLATFVFYGFFALFSGLFLLSSVLKWWLVPLTLTGLLLLFGLHQSQSKFAQRLQQLNLRNCYYLAFATLLQVSLVAIIYYVELHTVAPGTSFGQALTYTGAANFALFVSITPGAIGFRESFLLFSRHLHHISGASIVATNILDRAMYLIILLAMVVLIFGTHARSWLRSGIDNK